MHKMKLYLLSFLLIIGLISCQNTRKKNITLDILQTTDLHGTIFPYNFIENKAIENSLATAYSVIKEKRENNPDGVILLDNGDYLQGQPTVYYYNYEDTVSPHFAAEAFNYLKYDAATIGNHDIETGHAVYDRFRKQLQAPYLAANAVQTKTGEPYFTPYTIIKRQGIKIAILGMITPGIPQWLPESLWSGIEFKDMIETAQKWIPIIQQKEKPDLIIGMFHSGVDHLYGNENGSEYMNENATRLVAEKVPGFDIVLAGHDHKKYNEKLVNTAGDTVYLLDPRSHGRALAHIQIKLQFNKALKRYDKTIVPEIIELETQTPDSMFMTKFAPQFQLIKTYVSRQIGTLDNAIDSKDAYFGNSAFIDLIQTIQMEVSGADLSFSAPLSFRTQIEKGPVYISDLFKLYKYENLLYTMSLTGKEIDGYLEYSSAQWFNQMKNKNNHLLKGTMDENGNFQLENKYYNFSSASGIAYLVNVSKPAGEQVQILGFSNGQKFYSDSTYKVAINSYRGNGGGGHLTEGSGLSPEQLRKRLLSTSEYDLRYYVMKYFETHQTLKLEKGSNWRIIPEDFYEKGKRKDLETLFSN
jgi:2',3'-cyclic-nucleotide 2'-phosphodiesterase/3'-nucleotidase